MAVETTDAGLPALALAAALALALAGVGGFLWQVEQRRRRALRERLLRTEARLRTRELQLHGIFEAAPDAIVLCDAAGRIVIINHQAERLLGYRRREVLRKPVEILVPKALREAHQAHRQRFGDGPEARTMGAQRELTVLAKSGEEIPVDIRLARVKRNDRPHVVAAIRDLREHRQAEQALRESDALRRRIDEAERLNRLAVDREQRILELKREANRLAVAAREPAPYPEAAAPPSPAPTAGAADATEPHPPSDPAASGDERAGARRSAPVPTPESQPRPPADAADSAPGPADLLDGTALGPVLADLCAVAGVSALITARHGRVLAAAGDGGGPQARCAAGTLERLCRDVAADDYALLPCTDGRAAAATTLHVRGAPVANLCIAGFRLTEDGADAHADTAAGAEEPAAAPALTRARLAALLRFVAGLVEKLAALSLERHRAAQAQAASERRAEELRAGRFAAISLAEDLARARAETERYQNRLEEKVRERTAALRRSREELQAIVDNSPTLLHVKDRRGRYKLVNDRWCELARLSEADVLGRSDEMLFAPEVAAGMARDDEVVLDQGEPRQFEEVRRHGDTEIVLETYKFPLLDAQGRPYGLCGIAHDVTERKQNEAELRRARDQAREASRAKSAFLANVSHEIRTPINAIIGMTHLALAAELPARPRDYVDRAHQSANELLAIINDILDFSRIEAGKLTLETVPFRLEEVLQTVVKTIGPKAAQKGLELLLETPPEVPTALVGDPLRLSQVLINLAGNAVKFTNQGEVVLRVRVAEHSTEHLMLRFSVSDTGIGLAEDERVGLFEPFHQADSSRSRRFGGTGLGLAICKRLTEMMGGRLWVDSEPGVGSTFHCSARFTRQHKATPTQPTMPQDARVLVVDDNATARGILVMLVESFGPRTDAASDGNAALEALRTACAEGDPFGLVFLDWRMPGQDGIAVARAIAADATLTPKPRVVMVTAYGEEDLDGRAAELELAGSLAKPVSASAVYEAMLPPTVPPAEAPPAPRRRLGDPKDLEQLRDARVLLAEDHAINRDLAVEILTASGLLVDVAKNGREAVEMVQGRHYDAVLMDIHMPELDGYAAARRIRARSEHADLPIIAMTANNGVADRRRALEAGMNDHLTKPVDVQQLFAKLAQWVQPWTLAAAGSAGDDAMRGDAADPDAAGAPASGQQSPLRRTMLRRFCDEYQGFAASFSAAGNEPRTDARLRLAHTLKGVAGNLGLMEIAAQAGELEASCRDAASADALTPLAASIEAQVVQLAATLDRLAPPAPIEPPPCCELPALDAASAARVRDLAARLLALLADGDAEALATAAALADAVGADSDLGRRIAALQRRVEAFEFAAAAAELEALRDPIDRLGDASEAARGASLDHLITRLGRLLDTDDTDAADAAADLAKALAGRPPQAAVAERVRQSIDEFDYTAARTALAELRQGHAPGGGE